MTQQAPREWRLVGNIAENYEQYFVPAIFGPWAADLLDLAKPQQGERVLDVACGTGIVARLAAERVGPGGKVAGLDINPAMLAVAGSLPSTGASIEWRQASADAMPFPDEAFDLALCQQSLQFFPNKPAALREMHRALAPGGRLALSVWRDIERAPGYAGLAEALERHLGPDCASFVRLVCSLGSAADLKGFIQEAGFREIGIRSASRELRFSSPEDFVWQFVQATPLAMNAAVTQADDSTRASVVSEVAEKLQAYVDDDGLAFPIEAHVATARK